MKPSWNDAPPWAKWLAMDSSGKWYWYEREPDVGYEIWAYGGQYQEAGDGKTWTDTLEPRPGETK